MTAITFLFCLAAGLWGLWHLVEQRTTRRWLRWHGVTCLVGLLVAGFCGGREVARRNGTERIQADPIATAGNGMDPSGSQRNASNGIQTERRGSQRYGLVVAEIGPPPDPSAVPVLGYVTKSGIRYPSRWRMPPNASQTDNLKQP